MFDQTIDLERIAKTLTFTGWKAMRRLAVDKRPQPKLGDMVFEYTSINSAPYIDKVGVLIEDSDCIGKIQTLDGRVVSWSNHSFGLLPETM